MPTRDLKIIKIRRLKMDQYNIPPSLQSINLQFSPNMSPDEVAQCLRQYDKMSSTQRGRLREIKSNGISLEGLLSISKVITPISLLFA
jgi:hypothetical protein